MIELKLPKLPNRTPTQITIVIFPDLADALQRYADVYEEVYGTAEAVGDLIPYMLSAFIESDRGFAQIAKDGTRTRSVEVPTPSHGQFCQSACKRNPLSARKRDPLSGWRNVAETGFLALRAA